jgi:hypothetical protein
MLGGKKKRPISNYRVERFLENSAVGIHVENKYFHDIRVEEVKECHSVYFGDKRREKQQVYN